MKEANERTRRRGRPNLSVDTTTLQLFKGDINNDKVVPRQDVSRDIVPSDNKVSSAYDDTLVSKRERDGNHVPLSLLILLFWKL